MAFASQESRNLQLTTPLAEDALYLTNFEAYEAVSELYRYRLACTSPLPDIEPDDLIGEPVRITITSSAGERHFHGIVRWFRQEETSIETTRYSLEVVPPPWLLTRNTPPTGAYASITVPRCAYPTNTHGKPVRSQVRIQSTKVQSAANVTASRALPPRSQRPYTYPISIGKIASPAENNATRNSESATPAWP